MKEPLSVRILTLLAIVPALGFFLILDVHGRLLRLKGKL
jgi:hypothetical protein